MTKIERDRVSEDVILWLSHSRHAEISEAAYAVAVKSFTPHQLGALHRKMRERAEDQYWEDAAYGLY